MTKLNLLVSLHEEVCVGLNFIYHLLLSFSLSKSYPLNANQWTFSSLINKKYCIITSIWGLNQIYFKLKKIYFALKYICCVKVMVSMLLKTLFLQVLDFKRYGSKVDLPFYMVMKDKNWNIGSREILSYHWKPLILAKNIYITSIRNVENLKFNLDYWSQLSTILPHSPTLLPNLFFLPLLSHSFIISP